MGAILVDVMRCRYSINSIINISYNAIDNNSLDLRERLN